MLLNVVCDATSFEDLHTVQGILYHSFKEVCDVLGLLQDDKEWNQCLKEAEQIQSEAQLHGLFAIILLFCRLVRPEILWETHISAFNDDILFQACNNIRNMILDDDVHNKTLHHLEFI